MISSEGKASRKVSILKLFPSDCITLYIFTIDLEVMFWAGSFQVWAILVSFYNVTDTKIIVKPAMLYYKGKGFDETFHIYERVSLFGLVVGLCRCTYREISFSDTL